MKRPLIIILALSLALAIAHAGTFVIPTVPTNCHGVVDLTVGCAMPMLGGVP